MQEIKPIKRSNELAPLSREHQDGLLLVWKIRQGVRKQIAPERIVCFCKWFWENDLQPHTLNEERLLSKVLHLEHPMLQQMFAEHKLIRQKFIELSEATTYDDLEIIATMLNDHIRFEERQLFNEVEKLATPEDLQVVAKQLEHKNTCAVWEDEFWLNN